MGANQNKQKLLFADLVNTKDVCTYSLMKQETKVQFRVHYDR